MLDSTSPVPLAMNLEAFALLILLRFAAVPVAVADLGEGDAKRAGSFCWSLERS